MSIKSLLAFALALGFTGCITEVSDPLPPEDGTDIAEEDQPPIDPPGDELPGEGDQTCGAQLKGDGACTPP